MKKYENNTAIVCKSKEDANLIDTFLVKSGLRDKALYREEYLSYNYKNIAISINNVGDIIIGDRYTISWFRFNNWKLISIEEFLKDQYIYNILNLKFKIINNYELY